MKPKKLILLLFTALIMTNFCEAQTNKKTDLQKTGLKDAIRNVTEITYDVEYDSTEPTKGDKERTYFRIYDYNGYIVEYKYNNSNGDFTDNTFIHKYGNDGNRIEMSEYESDSLSFTIYFQYNFDGYLIGESYSFPDDSIKTWEIYYTYDSVGNMIEENWDNSDEFDASSSKWTYKYDILGNVIESNSYSYNDSVYQSTTYLYDSVGNIIEENTYNYSDSSFNNKITYEYDSHGNVIEENDYSSGIYKYAYKYDSHGNWIERRISNTEGVVKKITEREIIYF